MKVAHTGSQSPANAVFAFNRHSRACCLSAGGVEKIAFSMPQKDTSGIGERVPRELIDADFTVAFSFVQMAEEELHRGNGQLAASLRQRAESMLKEIQGRLLRMTPSQSEPFELRCAELAAAIKTAETLSEPETTG